MRQGLLGGSA